MMRWTVAVCAFGVGCAATTPHPRSYALDLRDSDEDCETCDVVGVWVNNISYDLVLGADGVFDLTDSALFSVSAFFYSGDAVASYAPRLLFRLPNADDSWLDLDIVISRARIEGNVLQEEYAPGEWSDVAFFDPERRVFYAASATGRRWDYIRRAEVERLLGTSGAMLRAFAQVGVPRPGEGAFYLSNDARPRERQRVWRRGPPRRPRSASSPE